MRITVTIDDDLLQAVRGRANQSGRTIGEVLSELIRTAPIRGEDVTSTAELHGVRPLPPRGRPVTNAIIDDLRGRSDD